MNKDLVVPKREYIADGFEDTLELALKAVNPWIRLIDKFDKMEILFEKAADCWRWSVRKIKD